MGRGTYKTGPPRSRRRRDPGGIPVPFPKQWLTESFVTAGGGGFASQTVTLKDPYTIQTPPANTIDDTGLPSNAYARDIIGGIYTPTITVDASLNEIYLDYSGLPAGSITFIFPPWNPRFRSIGGWWVAPNYDIETVT